MGKKSRMNREVHVRFCERFRGEIPLYLLDLFFICLIINTFNVAECINAGGKKGKLFCNFRFAG